MGTGKLTKLTEESVRAIRSEYATGEVTYSQLAAKYDSSQTRVASIVTGNAWRQVGGPVVVPRLPNRSKLTKEAVREIRLEYARCPELGHGFRIRVLAAKYGTAPTAISNAIRGLSWASVNDVLIIDWSESSYRKPIDQSRLLSDYDAMRIFGLRPRGVR